MTITALFIFCLVPLLLGGLAIFMANRIKKSNSEQLSFSPGIISTAIGVFLSISLFVLFNLPSYSSATGENWLRDPKSQELGNFSLIGIFIVGLISILGIAIGAIGIKNNTKSNKGTSWIGIIINAFVLLATPLFWLLLLIVMGTA